jgi:tyrosyl-tRNA synthetase
MTNGASAEKKEGKKSLKDEAKVSKRQMIAIWAALATALGSQGIPAIVEMLENKPDVEDVQTMIAQQTAKLTEQQNTAVEAIKELHADVKDLQKMSDDVAHVKGLVDVLRDVMRDCCTRRSAVRRLERKPAAATKPEPPPEPDKIVVEVKKPDDLIEDLAHKMMKAHDKPEKKRPIEQLQKVPEFDPNRMIQQQVQIQEPEE